MSDDELVATMTELATKSRRPEQKIWRGESKTATLAEPLTDTGTFTGYLAVVNNRDHQGDTILPGALDETLAEFRAGRIAWLLTDSHSEFATDVIARVTEASMDGHGLLVKGSWMPTERAQQLRGMVRAGAGLGLSIDYFPVVSRPDGKGGRLLARVTVVGGAVTPKPANPEAVIVEGKSGPAGKMHPSTAPIVDIYADAQAVAEQRDPDRDRRRRMAAMVDAAGWPPPELANLLGVEGAHALLEDAARRRALRHAEDDPERAQAQARRDRDNAYSNGLAAWMANAVDCGHRSCLIGACKYRAAG
jgi:Escherichia/Staphylococcus phage prohead protease